MTEQHTALSSIQSLQPPATIEHTAQQNPQHPQLRFGLGQRKRHYAALVVLISALLSLQGTMRSLSSYTNMTTTVSSLTVVTTTTRTNESEADNHPSPTIDSNVSLAGTAAAASAVAVADSSAIPSNEANKATSTKLDKKTTTNTATSNQRKSVAFLPLLPWEEASLSSSQQPNQERVCRPNKIDNNNNNNNNNSNSTDNIDQNDSVIPDYCCIGSVSSGGAMSFQPDHCRFDSNVDGNDKVDLYQQALDIAMSFMQPLNVTSNEQNVDNDECDWCHLIDNVLLPYNWTLAFLGDSVSLQTFVGVECELRRRGVYNVIVKTTFTAKNPKPRWRYGMNSVTELHVSRRKTNDGNGASSLKKTANKIILRYYAMYRPIEDMVEIQELVLNVQPRNDIVVFDFGLHYNIDDGEGDLFVTDMSRLVATLTNQTLISSHQQQPLKLLAWRETTAQHYNRTGGHYRNDIKTGTPDGVCTEKPFMSTPHAIQTTNRVTPLMHDIRRNLNLSHDQLVFLTRVRDYTGALPALLHPNTLHGDCSHYCSTPFLWLPIYRTLRIAVDEAVLRFKSSTSTNNQRIGGGTLPETVVANTIPAATSMAQPLTHKHDKDNVDHDGVVMSRSLAYLPLWQWEIDSLPVDDTNSTNSTSSSTSSNNQNAPKSRHCRPPPGTPEYCCAGAISAGGKMTFAPQKCRQALNVYTRAEQVALASIAPLNATISDTNLQCDWCRIIDVLLLYNWTMAFQGDSMTRQTFVGLECELRRRSNLYTVELTRPFPTDATPKKERWRYGLDEIYELRVTSKQSHASDSGGTSATAKTALIRFYAMYRPLEDMSDIETHVAASNDILIFDHGLHYGVASGDDEFLAEMGNLVESLVFDNKTLSLTPGGNTTIPQPKRKRPWNLLAWRETSSQHFDSPGGHFVPGVNEKDCVAIDAAQIASSNRVTRLMQQLLRERNISKSQLTILPFRDYTGQLHELHVKGDCSHYCSTPSLWLPLYRSLRMALDEAVMRIKH